MPQASLFVVPAKGEEDVVFGKVLSLAGASVVVVVGDRMTATSRHHDWVLVHVGFAMAKIDEKEAFLTLAAVKQLGEAYTDELEAFKGSPV